MPQEINFPGSLDDDTSLYTAVNNLRTQLTASISDSATTIPVVSTVGYPDTGFITILTGTDITDAEAIAYDGTDGTNFLNAERGADGTTATNHSANDDVDLTVVARHHENVKDAIINIETYLGASGSENFVPFVEGNVILPGTLSVQNTLTVSGGADFCFTTVTGTGDFQTTVTVSGIATVGEIPVAPDPGLAYATSTGTLELSSPPLATFQNTGIETAPLSVGDNILIYGATSNSEVGSNVAFNIQCVFDGVIAGLNLQYGSASNGPWGGTNLAGFKVVTGDGVATAKLQGAVATNIRNVQLGAASILAIPLGAFGLVEGDNYWYDNGLDAVTLVALGGDVVLTTITMTLPEDGDYILLGSVEAGHSQTFTARWQMDSVDVSETYTRIGDSPDYRTFSTVRLINTTQGSHTFDLVVSAVDMGGPDAPYSRGRIIVVLASVFDQVISVEDSTDVASTSATFAKLPTSEISYTPNQKESVVVLSQVKSSVSTTVAHPSPSYTLVDETSGINHMEDTSPGRFLNASVEHIPSLLFTKLDDVLSERIFSLSFRDAQDTTGTVTHEEASMLIWSMSETAVDDAIAYTTITDSKIRVAKVETECVDVINGGTVTVSGEPVLIGFPDDFQINNLTVTGTTTLQGPATAGDLTTATGTFTESLTISGVPVDISGGASSFNLTVRETDSNPSVSNVDTIVVSAGSLTDDAGGQVTIVTGGGGSALTVEEVDGNPSVANVTTIKVTNDSLTNEGSGVVRIDTGASSGGSGSSGELTTSGLWFNPQALPEEIHPKSDFFDDNSTNPTLSGNHGINWDKWTLWDVDTVSGTESGATSEFIEAITGNTVDLNMMKVHHDSSTDGGWHGFFQDAPAGDFTITARVSMRGLSAASTDFRAGIFMADDLGAAPSTSDLFSVHLHHSATPAPPSLDFSTIESALWTDYTSIGATVATFPSPYPGNSAWLKLTFDSLDGDMEAVWSEDGVLWHQLQNNQVAPFDPPGHIGFGIQSGASAGQAVAAFEFFAVSNTKSRGAPTGHGRMVPVVISGSSGGGSGDGTITSINTATGPVVTISGLGNVEVFSEDNFITISGTEFTGKTNFRGALIAKNAPQELDALGASGPYVVTWQTTVFDTDNWVDGNTFVVPSGISRVRLSCNIVWEPQISGNRLIQTRINSASQPGIIFMDMDSSGPDSAFKANNQVSGPIDVEQGDIIDLIADHDATNAIDITDATSTWFAVEVIEDSRPAFVIDEFTVVTGTFTSMLELPNLTTTERDAIGAPRPGYTIFNTTGAVVNVYNGTIWKEVAYV